MRLFPPCYRSLPVVLGFVTGAVCASGKVCVYLREETKNETVMRYLDPKADLTFKKVFGEHKDLLISLLNACFRLKARTRR